MFEDDKYQVIRNAISYDLANFIFNYLLMRRDCVYYMYKNNIITTTGIYGTWRDKQVPNVYSEYGNDVMETLLMKTLPIIKQQINLDLLPTYAYTRVYERGCELKKHLDRPSCEISATLHLGGNKWDIYMGGKRVDLNIGDMLIYSGCDLEHWREPFNGDLCGQVFLHYNRTNGKYAENNIYDGRAMLGLPSICKIKK
jgi:hypothetical protein